MKTWSYLRQEATELWDSYGFVSMRTLRKRARNAFELGYDAGEARLRDRIGQGGS